MRCYNMRKNVQKPIDNITDGLTVSVPLFLERRTGYEYLGTGAGEAF